MDDNWGKLYQAILDFNQPPSVVNALQFREEVPALAEGSGGALTPPLSDSFDWSIPFPTYDNSETSVSQLGIAPVNTVAPSPRIEDNDAAPGCRESLQSAWDIYSGPPAPGSDADRQQQLRAELRDSLHLREFSPEIGQRSSASSPESPRLMKRPTLDGVAMCPSPKKAKTCPKMWLMSRFQGTLAQSEQSPAFSSASLTLESTKSM